MNLERDVAINAALDHVEICSSQQTNINRNVRGEGVDVTGCDGVVLLPVGAEQSRCGCETVHLLSGVLPRIVCGMTTCQTSAGRRGGKLS